MCVCVPIILVGGVGESGLGRLVWLDRVGLTSRWDGGVRRERLEDKDVRECVWM